MNKNEITSVSDFEVNENKTITGNNDETDKKEENLGCLPWLLNLVLPLVLVALSMGNWIKMAIYKIRGWTIDENPFWMYNTTVFSVLVVCTGVLSLASVIFTIFRYSLRNRSVKNTVVEIALLTLAAFIPISLAYSLLGNPLTWFRVSYTPYCYSTDPLEYLFKAKLYNVYGLGWLAFFVLCVFGILAVAISAFGLKKETKYSADNKAKSSSLRFYTFAQSISADVAGTTLAFIFAVIAYVRFEKIGMYCPVLLVPAIIAVLCSLLTYWCGSRAVIIRSVRKHFGDPEFKELITQFRDSEDPNSWHKVRLDDDMIDELVVDLIDNGVLVKNKEDNDGNSELNKWYCVNTAAIDEYVSLESQPSAPNESKKTFWQKAKALILKVLRAFWQPGGRLLTVIFLCGIIGGVTCVAFNSCQAKKDYQAWIKQYAENPEVQKLVAESKDGLVFVPEPCTDYTLLDLIDKGLLIPSQSNLPKDQIDNRWYTFDDNLIEACQQAQNNTAEDTSPP